MEKIELRSEKVRSLIGSIPPTLVRYGNICLIGLISILICLAYFVEIPNTIDCNLIVEEKDNSSKLIITSCSKFINEKIAKGTPVSVYKNNDLIFTGFLSSDLENVFLTEDNVETYLPIDLPETIIINNQIHLGLKRGANLRAQIEINNQSILRNIFNRF